MRDDPALTNWPGLREKMGSSQVVSLVAVS
jgi:hypothetical protein